MKIEVVDDSIYVIDDFLTEAEECEINAQLKGSVWRYNWPNAGGARGGLVGAVVGGAIGLAAGVYDWSQGDQNNQDGSGYGDGTNY